MTSPPVDLPAAAAAAEPERFARRPAAVGALEALLAAGLDVDAVFEAVTGLVVPALASAALLHTVTDDRTLHLAAVRPVLSPALVAALPTRLSDSWGPGAALAAGRSQVTDALPALPALPGDARELRSGLSVVLGVDGRRIGVLTLLRAGAFGVAEIAWAERLADRAALALANALRFERHRRAAMVLQEAMLTDPPEAAGLEIVARYAPATRALPAGGDWYDAFVQPDGTLLVVIGDVAGQDTRAAAGSYQLRATLRSLAYGTDRTPADILRVTDQQVRDLGGSQLASAVVATISPERQVTWSNAGHPAPLAIRADGRIEILDADADLPLGVVPEVARHNHHTALAPGETLVLYTDGLIERDDTGFDVGRPALRTHLAELGDRPLEEMCDQLLTRMGPGGENDIAVLAVRVAEDAFAVPPPAARTVAMAHTSWPATSQAAGQARRLISDRALGWGLSGDLRSRAVLLTSEVVSNCVSHGSGAVRLRAYRLAPGGMRVEIDDDGPGVPIVRTPSAVDEHGRGMAIVAAVASRWGWWRRPDGGKTVWFEIDHEVAPFMG